jgi:hypothetical protein
MTMADAPKPSAWPSAFLAAATKVTIGAGLLYLAVQLIRSIALSLVVGLVATLVVWLLVRAMRIHRQRDWS